MAILKSKFGGVTQASPAGDELFLPSLKTDLLKQPLANASDIRPHTQVDTSSQLKQVIYLGVTMPA